MAQFLLSNVALFLLLILYIVGCVLSSLCYLEGPFSSLPWAKFSWFSVCQYAYNIVIEYLDTSGGPGE